MTPRPFKLEVYKSGELRGHPEKDNPEPSRRRKNLTLHGVNTIYSCMKKCKICLLEKSLEEFSKNKQTKDGFHTKCRACLSTLKAADYRQKWFRYLVRLKRAYCKKHSIPFDLSEEYLKSVWTDTCPVFDVAFVRFDKSHDYSPTLDRFDPLKGYTKGNVAFICARANRIKYDASVDELKKVISFMEGATTISKESTLK